MSIDTQVIRVLEVRACKSWRDAQRSRIGRAVRFIMGGNAPAITSFYEKNTQRSVRPAVDYRGVLRVSSRGSLRAVETKPMSDVAAYFLASLYFSTHGHPWIGLFLLILMISERWLK